MGTKIRNAWSCYIVFTLIQKSYTRSGASSSFRLAIACSKEGGSLCTVFFGSPPWPEAAASASRASRSALRRLAEGKSGAGRLKNTQG